MEWDPLPLQAVIRLRHIPIQCALGAVICIWHHIVLARLRTTFGTGHLGSRQKCPFDRGHTSLQQRGAQAAILLHNRRVGRQSVLRHRR